MKTYNKTILEFQRAIELNNDLCFKKDAEHQSIFVRDSIGMSLLKTNVFVVSTHTSKSCLLPVYGFYLYNGIEVRMRENFHDWVVSINAPFEFSLPDDLVYGDGENNDSDIIAPYCEGFKDSWVFPYKIKNTTQCTFRVNSNYKLYVIFYLLNKNNNENSIKIQLKDNEIKPLITRIWNDHCTSDIFYMFPKTYAILNNLCDSYIGNDPDMFANEMLKNEDAKKCFEDEYTLFKLGEEMDNNRVDWINEYLHA